jgi:hypothetical protein
VIVRTILLAAALVVCFVTAAGAELVFDGMEVSGTIERLPPARGVEMQKAVRLVVRGLEDQRVEFQKSEVSVGYPDVVGKIELHIWLQSGRVTRTQAEKFVADLRAAVGAFDKGTVGISLRGTVVSKQP